MKSAPYSAVKDEALARQTKCGLGNFFRVPEGLRLDYWRGSQHHVHDIFVFVLAPRISFSYIPPRQAIHSDMTPQELHAELAKIVVPTIRDIIERRKSKKKKEKSKKPPPEITKP